MGFYKSKPVLAMFFGKLVRCTLLPLSLSNVACSQVYDNIGYALPVTKKRRVEQTSPHAHVWSHCDLKQQAVSQVAQKRDDVSSDYTDDLCDDVMRHVLTYVVASNTGKCWQQGDLYLKEQGEAHRFFCKLRYVCKRWYRFLPMKNDKKWDYGVVLLTMETPKKLFGVMRSMLGSTKIPSLGSFRCNQKPHTLYIAMPSDIYLDFELESLSDYTEHDAHAEEDSFKKIWKAFAADYMSLQTLFLMDPLYSGVFDRFETPRWPKKVWGKTWRAHLDMTPYEIALLEKFPDGYIKSLDLGHDGLPDQHQKNRSYPQNWLKCAEPENYNLYEQKLSDKYPGAWSESWCKNARAHGINIYLLSVLSSISIGTLHNLIWKGGKQLDYKDGMMDLMSFNRFPALKNVEIYDGYMANTRPKSDTIFYGDLPTIEQLCIRDGWLGPVPEVNEEDNTVDTLNDHGQIHWSFSAFPSMFQRLKKLCLIFCEVVDGHHSPQFDMHALEALPSLRELTLRNVRLDGSLADYPAQLRQLDMLNLHVVAEHCGLTEALCQNWLYCNKTLKVLIISPCCLHPVGLTFLQQMLASKQLRNLRLDLYKEQLQRSAVGQGRGHRNCFLARDRERGNTTMRYKTEVTAQTIQYFLPAFSAYDPGIVVLPFCQSDGPSLAYLAQGECTEEHD